MIGIGFCAGLILGACFGLVVFAVIFTGGR